MSLARIKRYTVRLVLILLAAFIGFSACRNAVITRTNPLVSYSGNFDTTAKFVYKDLRATASITRETPRSCSVAFTSPPSLADMSFVFREGEVDLAYKGISFTFEPDSVPGGAAAKIAVSAINKAMSDDGVAVDYTDGVLSLNGVTDSGAFTLRLGSENDSLMKLSVPAEELEVEFINFNFLD